MHHAADDARTDVILTAATLLFGGAAVGLLAQLPGYPMGGLLGALLSVFWSFALTGLVPLLLIRYRHDGRAGLGLDGSASGWTRGLLLAVPVVVLEVVRALVVAGDPVAALLGRLGLTGPTVGPGGIGALQITAGVLAFITLSAGALLLVPFLVLRSRDAFPRSPEISLTELVRTIGIGAVVAALALGLLRAIGDPLAVPVLLQVAALAVVLLLVDRAVPTRLAVPRTTIVAPVVVVVAAHLVATGGLFFGDLLTGLYTGALAAGSTVAIAALVSVRRVAWAVVPLVVALHWWPSCLSPLAQEIGIAGC